MTTCGRCLTLPIVVDRILPSQRLTTKLTGPQRTLRAEVSALGHHRPALRADNSGPQALESTGLRTTSTRGTDNHPSQRLMLICRTIVRNCLSANLTAGLGSCHLLRMRGWTAGKTLEEGEKVMCMSHLNPPLHVLFLVPFKAYESFPASWL